MCSTFFLFFCFLVSVLCYVLTYKKDYNMEQERRFDLNKIMQLYVLFQILFKVIAVCRKFDVKPIFQEKSIKKKALHY